MTERITLDLSGSEDATTSGGGDFAPLPKGWYRFFIYSSEVRFAKTNGKPDKKKPYFNTRLNLHPDDKKAGHSSVIFDGFAALYTTEKAPWLAQKAEQLARITGSWDGEDRTKVTFPTTEELEGTEVEAYLTVKVDDYATEKYIEENGEEPETPIRRNEVSAYRPVGGWPKPGEEGKTGAKGAKAKTSITL